MNIQKNIPLLHCTKHNSIVLTPKYKKKSLFTYHLSQAKAYSVPSSEPAFIILIRTDFGLPFVPLLADSDINLVFNGEMGFEKS